MKNVGPRFFHEADTSILLVLVERIEYERENLSLSARIAIYNSRRYK